jgi:DHA3 family macrolide efflux protein-like MFS transporter
LNDLVTNQQEAMVNDSASATEQVQAPSMRPFFTIWTGQAFSLLGSELVQFALVWWLTATTGSATVLALASMVAVLPRIFVSPVAGVLVDRWSRRIVMMVADSMIALAVVVLAVLYALDAVHIWHIYVLMFLRAVGGAFHWPAMQASTTLMVPQEHLSRVAGLNQTLQGLTNIAVPPMGALLLEVLPMQSILAIDVATAILAIVPLFFIPVPQPERKAAPEAAVGGAQEGATQPSVLADLREGLRFVWGWPGLTVMLVIAALSNLLANPAFTLVPLLVSGHFGGGALELGWLQSAFGIGFVVGGLTLGAWGGFKRRIVTAYLAQILSGVGFVVIGMSPANAFLLAVGATFFIGFTNPIINGSLMAVFQTIVPAEMQGRVFTLLMSVTGVTTPLGLAIAGPVGDAVGVQPWFLVTGIVVVAMGAGALFVPAIVRIEDRVNLKDRVAPPDYD